MNILYAITSLIGEFAMWILPLVPFAASLLCFLYRRVSGWTFLLALGLNIIGFFLLSMSVIEFLHKKDVFGQEVVDIAAAIAELGMLFAAALTLAGLAKTLSHVQKRLPPPEKSADDRKQPPTPRPTEPEVPELDEVKEGFAGKKDETPDK